MASGSPSSTSGRASRRTTAPDPRSREHRPDDPLQPEQARGAVIARMKDYEPADELQILMELSIDPVAQQLGLLSADTTLSN